MVGHHDEVTEMIAVVVKMFEVFGNNSSQIRSAQGAISVPLIQILHKLTSENLVVLDIQVRLAAEHASPRSGCRIDSLAPQPSIRRAYQLRNNSCGTESAVRNVTKTSLPADTNAAGSLREREALRRNQTTQTPH